MRGIFNGKVTEILDRTTDYHVTYATSDGITRSLTIDKRETSQGDLIRAAKGETIEVRHDRLRRVRRVKIARQGVLAR